MRKQREWRLYTYLSGLLLVGSLLTFFIVGSAFLLIRIPQLEDEIRGEVGSSAREIGSRIEMQLGSLQSRLELVDRIRHSLAPEEVPRFFDAAIGDGQAIRALFLLSERGRVMVAGVNAEYRPFKEEMLDNDLSSTPLFMAVQQRRMVTWSDKYLSSLSGTVTLGLALPLNNGQVLLAEVPLPYLINTMKTAIGTNHNQVWVLDQRGELLASTESEARAGSINLYSTQLFRSAISGEMLPQRIHFDGRDQYAGVAHSHALGWTFIARLPAGLEHPEIRMTVGIVAGGFVASLLIGFALSLFWASRLQRPLSEIVTQAHRVAAGEDVDAKAWPQGRIAEINRLSTDIALMADAIQEREHKFLAIFNASPVPMAVSEVGEDSIIIDINEAWSRQFGRSRASVQGRSGDQIGLWESPAERQRVLERAMSQGGGQESFLLRGDGSALLCQISAQWAEVGGTRLLIWAMEDITDVRRIEKELRELNAELESRVAQRTLALENSNQALTHALKNLRETQHELVRVEKMAALGHLVAGVAHELNTPLGNGLLAVSTLEEEVNAFEGAMAEGVRRSMLERLITSVRQASSIATFNLRRAAELVMSFKQVATDQRGVLRTQFLLLDVVEEVIMTTSPEFRRRGLVIQRTIPPELRMDSYPGPLGQVLISLVNNTVAHAFDGRATGCVEIVAVDDLSGMVEVSVKDDGWGIAPELLPRVFDPFFTTRMGRSSGLGLHIAYNTVVNMLGGTLTAQSELGHGATFTLRIPRIAPADRD